MVLCRDPERPPTRSSLDDAALRDDARCRGRALCDRSGVDVVLASGTAHLAADGPDGRKRGDGTRARGEGAGARTRLVVAGAAMIADASRIRRARIAIYGPAVTGVLGIVLLAGGVLGVTQSQLSTAGAPVRPDTTVAMSSRATNAQRTRGSCRSGRARPDTYRRDRTSRRDPGTRSTATSGTRERGIRGVGSVD